MVLTGFHPRLMDEKKRVAIPKAIREQLGEGEGVPLTLYVAPDPNGCLRIYREEELERYGRTQVGAVEGQPEAEAKRRAFFACAANCQLDAQGRLLLPERLVRHAGLNRKVILLGVHDHLELWDPDRLRDYLRQAGLDWEQLPLE